MKYKVEMIFAFILAGFNGLLGGLGYGFFLLTQTSGAVSDIPVYKVLLVAIAIAIITYCVSFYKLIKLAKQG
ncbi:hypothetical protein [Motilimonas pumila]|uniref:Uncharacterized protein n=1 Tax=Motilimonas pumila TaxID=2303987 RepID=A0A418YF71_9GAMM|nr:hypothetical protein [Motilimonas pumila]RJG47918.1 hypothetical protein D1Z90_09395 [Motilimonas pumila]